MGSGNGLDLLLKSVVGDVLLRPWFDEAAVRLLAGWYFPLSRAWAAAVEAGGDVGRFREQLACGDLGGRLLPAILRGVEERRAAYAAADARWERAFFGDGTASATAEAARLEAAQALMATRAVFAPLHLEVPFPAVGWSVDDRAAVEDRYGARIAEPARAFAAPEPLPPVEASRPFRSGGTETSWVRFASAAAGDTAWARVLAPAGAPALGTLIFAPGVAMENEMWGGLADSLSGLTERGLRIVRPEAPWHGRRRRPGLYGGEPLFARGPAGLIDFYHAYVVELGVLCAWARATGDGPVAVGGGSLGALSAQLVAVAARHWPAAMRPDALFVVAPSRSMTAVAFEGRLTGALGVPAALRAAGWSPADAERFRPLMEPVAAPALDPARIVAVLGETDDVTLAAEGERIVADWRVPPANVFRFPAGHFSTTLGLAREDAPLARIHEVMAKAARAPSAA